HSNYLAPRVGFLSADTWVLWASYLRNFLLGQLILMPATMAVLLLSRLLLVFCHTDTQRYFAGVFPVEAAEYVVGAVIAGLWLVAGFVAFLGSGRVRLSEAGAAPGPGGPPLSPGYQFWWVLMPLLAAAILMCFYPASRRYLHRQRERKAWAAWVESRLPAE